MNNSIPSIFNNLEAAMLVAKACALEEKVTWAVAKKINMIGTSTYKPCRLRNPNELERLTEEGYDEIIQESVKTEAITFYFTES